MPDNERARIRGIMYEPSSVWLATENSGDRWLTDQFVLYNVTDAEVLYCYDCSYDVYWPDGPYQLMASGDWRMKDRDSIPEPDIEAWFEVTSATDWRAATPTEWSVAEHPGKAMLWVAGDGVPCLLGESTWTAIKRHHPEVEVTLHPERNLFRFSAPRHVRYDADANPEPCVAYECDGCVVAPFAFAAGIQIPEGQEDVAYEIARAV